MSLIKSFNASYLKENIKKSRGIILLLIILVPLFTALHTVVNVNGTEEYTNIPDKEWLSTVNMYGMYIIPVVLSFLLFGYVYKKNSVDLINSMPINRKSIFVTNTVVGIIIISIIQIITALVLIICNQVLSNIYIYTSVIIDIFIVTWVAYVFIFTAANLAMTMSGTVATQILLTALIVLLVPFLFDYYNDFSNFQEYKFVVGNTEFTSLVEIENTFTLPYKNLKFNNYYYESEHGVTYNIYNTTSIVKMLGLSALYLLLGTYLFNKRKMENCEESFAKDRTHIFVKALTILPMLMLLNMYSDYGEENRTIIFNLCLIIFYYYIYDFIVKRKVGAKASIAGLVITLAVLQGSCMGINHIKQAKEMPVIKIEDVEEIAVGLDNYYDSYYTVDVLDIVSGIEHFVKSDKVIDSVLRGAADIEEQRIKYDEELERYNNNEIEYMTSYVDNTRLLDVVLKLNNGKEYRTYLNISDQEYNNMIETLENDETYMNLVLAELEKDDKLLVDSKLCSEELQNKLKAEIKNKITSINKEKMFLDGGYGSIGKYYYEDHKLVYKDICIELTPEMLNLCAREINKNSLAKLKDVVEKGENRSFYIDLNDEPMWFGLSNKYFDFQRTKEDMTALMLDNEEFNANESFYMLEGNTEDSSRVVFFTNKVDEVDNLIQLEVERNQEYYWQYEYELEKYYRSDWLYENHYYEDTAYEEVFIEDDYSEEYTEDYTYDGNYVEEDYVMDNTIYVEDSYTNDVTNSVANEVTYENIV